MTFEYCNKCFRHHLILERCYPVFQCAIIQDGDNSDDEDTEYCFEPIGANDAEDAAERFAEEYDTQSDVVLIHNSKEGVTVLVENEAGVRKYFTVTGEAVVEYCAIEIIETITA